MAPPGAGAELGGQPVRPRRRGSPGGVGHEPASGAEWPDGRTSRAKFANLWAELWWKAREALGRLRDLLRHLWDEPEGVAHPLEEVLLPKGEALARQLASPRWFLAGSAASCRARARPRRSRDPTCAGSPTGSTTRPGAASATGRPGKCSSSTWRPRPGRPNLTPHLSHFAWKPPTAPPTRDSRACETAPRACARLRRHSRVRSCGCSTGRRGRPDQGVAEPRPPALPPYRRRSATSG